MGDSNATTLADRVESFIRFKWGPLAVERPRALMDYRSLGPVNLPADTEILLRVFFDDNQDPQMIGIRALSPEGSTACYEITECSPAGRVRRRHWRFDAGSGWQLIGVTELF